MILICTVQALCLGWEAESLPNQGRSSGRQRIQGGPVTSRRCKGSQASPCPAGTSIPLPVCFLGWRDIENDLALVRLLAQRLPE